MFNECINLEKIIFGENFKTENVEDMNHMFLNCKNLKELNLSKFNTSTVNDMSYMFKECISLEKIIFGENFRTVKVENMSCMFFNCKNLGELDLHNFDTGSVKLSGLGNNEVIIIIGKNLNTTFDNLCPNNLKYHIKYRFLGLDIS